MTNLYLDEEKAALNIFETKDLGYRPSVSICLIAKYFIHIKGMTAKETETSIVDFIKNETEINFKPSDWDKCIAKCIKRAETCPLIKIDSIKITNSEIEMIQKLDRKPLQRLAFTLLCLAKYHNEVSDKNNNWVNCPILQIFKLAEITGSIKSERLLMLNELYNNNMIKYGKKNTNINICVDYVCDNSDVALEIFDMRELGKEYMLYCGGKYVRCKNCGLLISKGKNGKSVYCKDCAKEIDRLKAKERMDSIRKS